MAEPDDTAPRRRPPVGKWIIATFIVLVVLQLGPLVLLVVSDQIEVSAIADPSYLIGYTLGSIALPMLVACVALLLRRGRGPAYLALSVLLFLFATFGSLAG
ncbi:hypothetical protein HKCCE4037_11075 [Rhodobacterales bacterium HKCCE4037]|nr:hypothetical protein [Rhodobacterales bacterium HKCCE4037]